MTSDLHTHIKHFLITAALITGALIGLKMYAAYQTHIAEVMAQRDEQIAANQNTVKQSQNVITVKDTETEAKLADLRRQLNQKLDSNQAQGLIKTMLPGVNVTSTKDQQGNSLISIPDTQENRDKLNQVSTDYKSCIYNLDACSTARTQYEKVIIPAKDDTIKRQADQIVDLKKYQVPKWTLLAGVGKSQGTTFQDVNSYQPFLGLGYRFTSRYGVFTAVQNKSAAVGIMWSFGSVKQ